MILGHAVWQPGASAVSELDAGTARQVLETSAGSVVQWTSNVDIPGTLDVTGLAVFDSAIRAASGSVLAPGISFSADIDSGLYHDGGTTGVRIVAGGGAKADFPVGAAGISFWTSGGAIKAWENGDNYSWFQISTSAGPPHFRLISIEGTAKFGVNMQLGNVGIGGLTAFGTDAEKVLAFDNGVAPTTSPADVFQMYSADIVAGNAAPHFRTEDGNVIRLYQQAGIIDADGTLADITTKFNTLLGRMENTRLLAVA